MASEYRRLPGRGKRLLGRSRLWLAHDHLLSVESSGYSETYKRFYFRDIQAVVVRQTQSFLYWNVAWFVLAAGTGGLMAAAVASETKIPAFIATACLLLCLIINLILGPTCAAQIQTAVQKEQLLSLHRLRTARKVLSIVRPLVEAAQGNIVPSSATQAPPASGPQ